MWETWEVMKMEQKLHRRNLARDWWCTGMCRLLLRPLEGWTHNFGSIRNKTHSALIKGCKNFFFLPRDRGVCKPGSTCSNACDICLDSFPCVFILSLTLICYRSVSHPLLSFSDEKALKLSAEYDVSMDEVLYPIQERSQDFSKGGSHCVKVRVLTILSTSTPCFGSMWHVSDEQWE